MQEVRAGKFEKSKFVSSNFGERKINIFELLETRILDNWNSEEVSAEETENTKEEEAEEVSAHKTEKTTEEDEEDDEEGGEGEVSAEKTEKTTEERRRRRMR